MIYRLLFKVLAWALRKKAIDARIGPPFVGEARCECGHTWDVLAPGGVDPDIELTCERCERETARLV